MDKAHKAIFNSLRMSFLNDPTLHYDAWKVEDIRPLHSQILFSRLQEKNIYLDKSAFLTYSEPFDAPEEFMEWLIEDFSLDPESTDYVYLIIFELWRRFVPEKISISIFANDLDWLIFSYEQGDNCSQNALEADLENLYNILRENVDQGMKPQEAFSAVSEFFAHDLEPFLYSFISIQIDQKDFLYAKELLDRFFPFVIDTIWLLLLNARLIAREDSAKANQLLVYIFQKNQQERSVDLNLDMLEMMVHAGDYTLFLQICEHTLTLIDHEEDFIELLTLASDYFRCLDQEDIQEKIDGLIAFRTHNTKLHFSINDPDSALFRHIIGVEALP